MSRTTEQFKLLKEQEELRLKTLKNRVRKEDQRLSESLTKQTDTALSTYKTVTTKMALIVSWRLIPFLLIFLLGLTIPTLIGLGLNYDIGFPAAANGICLIQEVR